MDETMGDRIKRLRIARGFSVDDLASRLGVKPAAVYKWQVGDTKDIRNETLALLCRELATDLPYLVWGEDRAPKPPMGSGSAGTPAPTQLSRRRS